MHHKALGHLFSDFWYSVVTVRNCKYMICKWYLIPKYQVWATQWKISPYHVHTFWCYTRILCQSYKIILTIILSISKFITKWIDDIWVDIFCHLIYINIITNRSRVRNIQNIGVLLWYEPNLWVPQPIYIVWISQLIIIYDIM